MRPHQRRRDLQQEPSQLRIVPATTGVRDSHASQWIRLLPVSRRGDLTIRAAACPCGGRHTWRHQSGCAVAAAGWSAGAPWDRGRPGARCTAPRAPGRNGDRLGCTRTHAWTGEALSTYCARQTRRTLRCRPVRRRQATSVWRSRRAARGERCQRPPRRRPRTAPRSVRGRKCPPLRRGHPVSASPAGTRRRVRPGGTSRTPESPPRRFPRDCPAVPVCPPGELSLQSHVKTKPIEHARLACASKPTQESYFESSYAPLQRTRYRLRPLWSRFFANRRFTSYS